MKIGLQKTTPLRGQSVITRLILHVANQYTKFEVSIASAVPEISHTGCKILKRVT